MAQGSNPLGNQGNGIKDLLADAKLVADYGCRAGRFGKDEELFDAIRGAAAKGDSLDWTTPEAVTLQKALGKALQTIYPVTLHDLKSSWDSDVNYQSGFWPRVRSVATRSVVLVATAYVLLLCASLTVWQQRASNLVGELSVDKVGQQEKAFDELLVLIGSDQLGDLRNPASPLRESFRQKQREIQSIQRSMYADYMTLARLDDYTSPNDYIGSWLGSLTAAVGNTGGEVKPVGPQSPTDEPLEASAPGAAEAATTRVVATPNGAIQVLPADQKEIAFTSENGETLDCNQITTQYYIDKSNAILHRSGEENSVRSIRLFMSALDFDEAFIKRIKCQMEPALGGAGMPDGLKLAAFDIQYRLDIMNLWWLPALYGALGALIYHLREFLSGTRPDPTFLKMMVRVGLGAFAGIAIGWFWMPKDASVLGIPEITFAPLSIAFLVGFGIDAFVAVLDRLVVSINRWIAGPAPAAGG